MKFLSTLLLFIATSFGSVAQAADLYICKCDTGAHGSCVAGNDSTGTGTTASSPKLSRPSNSAITAMAAPSRVLFCEGGYWNNEAMLQFDGYQFSATAPLTFESYSPPTGATGQPILRAAGSAQIFQTGGFFDTTWRGGYVWRNLKMIGQGGNSAIFFNKYVQDILLDNVWIEGWYSGLLWSIDAGQTRCRRMIVKNSTFYRNTGNGYLGSCSDFTLEDNLFEENNFGGTALQHAMYHGSRSLDSHTIVRRNRLINNSVADGSGLCTSGQLTIRGDKDQTLIEDNYIYVPNGAAGCYGISITSGYLDYDHEVMYRTVIRGNTIVGVGRCMELQITPYVVVENNRCYQNTSDSGVTGINISISDEVEAIYPPQGAIVRNNTIALIAPQGNGGCINFIPTTANAFQVFNNACYIGGGAGRCWNNLQLISNYSIWNYNWCQTLGSGGWSAYQGSIGEAQGSGFDINGGVSSNLMLNITAPISATDSALHPSAGSPLINAGRNTGKPPRDHVHCQRSSTPTVGAFEYGGTPCLTVTSPIVH